MTQFGNGFGGGYPAFGLEILKLILGGLQGKNPEKCEIYFKNFKI